MPDSDREQTIASDAEEGVTLERPLDPAYVHLQRVVRRLFALAVATISFAGLLVVLTAADEMPLVLTVALPAAWLGLIVLLLWHAERWPSIEYDHVRYRLDTQGIEIRRGVYWRRVINVPRSRVQHTDVSQGPLERRYGLGTLVIFTAGTDHARVDLPGLEHGHALRVRDQLRPEADTDAV